MTLQSGVRPSRWLDARAERRLRSRIEEALRRGRGGPTLVSVSCDCDPAIDPTATVAAGRQPGEPWFCLDQPARGGAAVAALGQVTRLTADGRERFEGLSAGWRAVLARALADPPQAIPGGGLVAVGGFAFATGGADSPPWEQFGSGSLDVPAISLARQHDRVSVTANVMVDRGASPDAVLAQVEHRLRALEPGTLPLLDPAPVGRYTVRSAMPPSHYEEAVATAVHRIRSGALEKVVLAREVEVTAPSDHDPAAVLAVLRVAFPDCFSFAVGRGEGTFLGASPELLVRREGARASTVALAGSARRSADPAVDAHLGEQLLRSGKDRHENEVVVRRIERALAPHALWLAAAPEPGLVRVANIQHLARPIRAQLARPLDALALAGLLHPTPAVGGEPWAAAEALIPALEGFDRGWYAGPVGWVDSAGDGEFCVALRCALLRGCSARLFAGAGIVADSDPAAELAETEVKLQALLPVLSG